MNIFSLKVNKDLNNTRSWLAFGACLIVISLMLGSYGLLSALWDQPKKNAFTGLAEAQPDKLEEPLITGVPNSISISSVNINLPVTTGLYDQQRRSWSLSLDKAHWGVMTEQPNNKQGLTFIYGHNRKQVFSRLPGIKLGEQAIVKTDNDRTFVYKFTHSIVTDPTDTSLFNYKGKPVLVLQTCTGSWYQDRQLFVFELAEAS